MEKVLFFFKFFKYTSVQYSSFKISKVGDLVKGDLKAPFSIATTPRCRVGEHSTPFRGLLYFTLDLHLLVLSAKQGDNKNHFFFCLLDHW